MKRTITFDPGMLNTLINFTLYSAHGFFAKKGVGVGVEGTPLWGVWGWGCGCGVGVCTVGCRGEGGRGEGLLGSSPTPLGVEEKEELVTLLPLVEGSGRRPEGASAPSLLHNLSSFGCSVVQSLRPAGKVKSLVSPGMLFPVTFLCVCLSRWG